MSFVAILLLVAVTSIAQTHGACASGWEEYNNCCYLFSKAKVTFSEANTKCAAGGGALAEISGPEEGVWVRKEAKKSGLDKVWLKVSEEMMKSTFNKISKDLEKTHCISWTSDQKWQDGSCDAKYMFVCKKC
ncbi:lithostathine-1-like [Ostrea edulis]|uniref:lithostathine-1-like n=1 Tax=Ostrea edulis TaxID=37623 RepID=UPI0024AE8E5E|nr:lithostathine-1-like [Ostrea edulis]